MEMFGLSGFQPTHPLKSVGAPDYVVLVVASRGEADKDVHFTW